MNTRLLAHTLVIALLALLSTTAAVAEIYKSVDENGNAVFSQKAPRDAKSEVIKPRFSKPPTPPAGAAPFVPPTQPGALPSATDAAPATPELTPEQRAAQHKNCDDAHARLKELQGPRANRLQYVNDQQELAFLTPELLATRIKEAQDIAAKNCAAEDTLAAPAP